MAWIAACALLGLSKLTNPVRKVDFFILISRKKSHKRSLVFTETFALVGGSVNEYFGADDVSEGQEHLHELRITKLLGKVIDKEITALGTGDGAS